MTEALGSLDVLLFVVLPYAAAALFVAGTVERFRRHVYSLTSHSSQFLENRQHFWALVPFHYGILVVLAGHLVAFALPRSVLAWNGRPLRLYILEATALAFGLLALVGFVEILLRRTTNAKVRATTALSDWIVYAALLVQLASGVYVALGYQWGSSWFAIVAAPYLRSLALFRPDAAAIVALPLAIRLHVASAFVLLAVFPFSRLMHVLNVPNAYLWRRPLVVRWYRRRPAPVEG